MFIEKVLARHNGDVRLAAEQLGMSRSALYRRLQQYGVRDRREPRDGRTGASSRPSWALSLLGGLPAAVALVCIVWGQNYTFEVRWTLAAVVLVVWIGCALAAAPDGDARALSRRQPARRAARGRLLDPRHRRQAGQRRRSA